MGPRCSKLLAKENSFKLLGSFRLLKITPVSSEFRIIAISGSCCFRIVLAEHKTNQKKNGDGQVATNPAPTGKGKKRTAPAEEPEKIPQPTKVTKGAKGKGGHAAKAKAGKAKLRKK